MEAAVVSRLVGNQSGMRIFVACLAARRREPAWIWRRAGARMLVGVPPTAARGIPISGRCRFCDAIEFERDVLELHVEACKRVWEIGNPQMNGCDTRAAKIARVQRASDRAKGAHQLIERNRKAETAAEQRLKLILSAGSERVGASLEEWRASEKEPVFRAVKA